MQVPPSMRRRSATPPGGLRALPRQHGHEGMVRALAQAARAPRRATAEHAGARQPHTPVHLFVVAWQLRLPTLWWMRPGPECSAATKQFETCNGRAETTSQPEVFAYKMRTEARRQYVRPISQVRRLLLVGGLPQVG